MCWGGNKTPGQRRWDITSDNTTIEGNGWDRYGNPKINFTHRNGDIINTDVPEATHVSKYVFRAGTPQEMTVWVNPRADCTEAEAQMMQERMEALPKANELLKNLHLD